MKYYENNWNCSLIYYIWIIIVYNDKSFSDSVLKLNEKEYFQNKEQNFKIWAYESTINRSL